MLVRFTGPGYGYIHVSVRTEDGAPEPTMADNSLAYGIRIYG